MSKVIEITRDESLSSLAKQYLALNDGNTENAIDDLYAALLDDPRLLKKITTEAINEAVRSSVNYQHRKERAAIFNEREIKNVNTINVGGTLQRLVTFHQRLLLDFPLSKGLKLRDATRQDVLEQIDIYARTEKDAGKKRRWLTSIAYCLKNDKQTVGKVITEEKAKELFEEAA